jgi:hypothetical protein
MRCAYAVSVVLLAARVLWAGDAEIAAGYAGAAAKLNGEGKPEKAKSLCYKALANDERCAAALYELGKLFEAEGSVVSAANFYSQTVRVLTTGDPVKGEDVVRLAEARRRLATLNPYAARLTGAMQEYSQGLSVALKKAPDSMSEDGALSRINALNLARYLPPEKLPQIQRATDVASTTKPPATTGTDTATSKPPGPATKATATSTSPPDPETGFRRTRAGDEPPAKTSVSPEVERALRAAGWTSISGTWKQVEKNVYEVTDGRLEAQKTNGGISVIVRKGSTATISVFARYSADNRRSYYLYDDGSYYYAPGYGFVIKGSSYSMYTPYAGFRETSAYKERTANVVDGPKHIYTVEAMTSAKASTKLTYYIDGKREKSCDQQINTDGPFVIAIRGTVVIEQPQAVGQ